MNKYAVLLIIISLLIIIAYLGTIHVSAQPSSYYYAGVGGVIVSGKSPGIDIIIMGIVVAATLIASYAVARKIVKKQESK